MFIYTSECPYMIISTNKQTKFYMSKLLDARELLNQNLNVEVSICPPVKKVQIEF